jgi:hypothetical protein
MQLHSGADAGAARCHARDRPGNDDDAALEMIFKGHIGGLSDRRDGLANTPGRRDQFHIVTSGTALFALLSYAQVMREIQNAA